MSTPNPTGVFQIVESVKSVNKRWENQPRVPISTTKMLPAGQFVDISEYPIGQINIQKTHPK